MPTSRRIALGVLQKSFRVRRLVVDFGMDRASIVTQSDKLERHIAAVESDLTRQRELVADLLRANHDATGAMSLLRQFEELYARLLTDRDVVRRQLDYARR